MNQENDFREDDWLSTGQVAKELNVTSRTIVNWIRRDNVFNKQTMRKTVGGHYRIPYHEVKRVQQEMLLL